MINTLKPPALKQGDTIGIVATSFPLPSGRLDDAKYTGEYHKGIAELESMGFRVKEGPHLRAVKWWFAGTPEERAVDINGMYADPEVKAVIVHEGGQSAAAVLEHLDYDLIRRNPKPFIGFSDITNIHLAMFAQTGLVGLQGPLLTYGLGRVWEQYLPGKVQEGKELLYRILTSTAPLGLIRPLTRWECWRDGCAPPDARVAEGPLFGGNLGMMCALIGTRYFSPVESLRGCVLFWETDNTNSYRIERGLYQLKYAGVLDVISGMLVGKLPGIRRTAWPAFEEPTPREIVLSVLDDTAFPILGEVDFGHETVNMPMPIGIRVRMDAAARSLEFLEPAVR